MDIMFRRIQKEFSSSEKKFKDRLSKCSLFKARGVHQVANKAAASAQSSYSDASDALVMVARPPPDVRLVLFQEVGDTCERLIIFDSKCLRKIDQSNSDNQSAFGHSYEEHHNTNNNESKRQYEYETHTPTDWKVLSEMLFGSVGMAQKAASLKIHYMKNPPAIMMSRVFCLSSLKENTTASLDRGMESHFEMQRTNSILSRRKAKTMPVPFSSTSPTSSLASSYSSQSGMFLRSDSSASISSLFNSYPSAHSASVNAGPMRIPSYNGRAHSLPKHQRDSFTLSDDASDKVNSAIRRTRRKIGFAVLCYPEPSNEAAFQQFFFQHFPIIESHMTRLKEDIEKAFQPRYKCNFIDIMMKALGNFSSNLNVIYSTPRLPEPVWSTLTLSTLVPKHRKLVVDTFIADMARVTSEFNTKQTNFFVSGLLTAVLTYHLGWVESATPSSIRKHFDDKNTYNPLWAQLGDLYGAVGSPTKVCRTVVTGSNHELVSTFLSMLSYFIRSARVDDVVSVPDAISPSTFGMNVPASCKSISMSLIPCDLDDSEYVFVSVDDQNESDPDDGAATEDTASSFEDATSANKINRSVVMRTKSSPNKQAKENTTNSLSRSYSGPMIKRTSRMRSNAFLDADLTNSIRSRTYSNNVMTKHKGVQSRRKSRETTDVATATSISSSLYCKNNQTSHSDLTTSCTSLNVHGSFCMKQNVNMRLPEHPVNSESSLKTSKSWNVSTSTSPDSMTADTEKREVIPLFAESLEPPVARVVNLQRACPSSVGTVMKPVVKRVVDSPTKNKFTFDQPAARENHTDSGSSDTGPMQVNLPVRSLSNPSVQAQNLIRNTHKRSVSTTGVKIKTATRRSALPTSPNSGDNSLQVGSTPGKTTEPKPESPSFQRIKLLRIPSVEINHNVFDEYFDKDTGATKSDSKNVVRASNDTNNPEDKGGPKNIIENHKKIPVTSCPNLTNLPSKKSEDISNHNTARTNSPDYKVKPLYPDLKAERPQSLNVNNEPSIRSNDVKKLYPPLPSKPPVGVVTFNVGNEKVSFHSKKAAIQQLPSPRETPSMMANTIEPSNLASPGIEQTSQEVRPAANLLFTELPLADIDVTNPSAPSNSDKEGTSATGFASLMADYNPEYLNDFILHGAQNHPDTHGKILKDLNDMVRNSTLDEPVAEAVCILADTDTLSVKVYSSQRLHSDKPSLPAMTSKLVSGILNRVASMAKLKVSSEFCLSHLESELRQLVLKSRMLAEYVRGKKVTVAQLSAALSIESQDLPLLMAIASCHSPHVAPILI